VTSAYIRHNTLELTRIVIIRLLVEGEFQGKSRSKAAKAELRQLFPKIPVGSPDGGDSEDSGYLHLLVDYLAARRRTTGR
jgi:hypothetical protein